jgi:hypothetical protein
MRPCSVWLAPLVLLAGVLMRAPLEAQPLDRSGAGALTGTFVSADAQTVVVRTDQQALVTFSVEDQASVPAGLMPGMPVTVRYDVTDDGRYRVVRVGVASYPPEPGSTTSLPPPPAAAPTPGPPAASPPPPPGAATATSARRTTPEPRSPARSVADRAAVRRAPDASPPALAEPSPESPAHAVSAAAAPSADSVPPREPTPGRDLLKIGGLLLLAGGLVALAYAFLRGYA